MARLVDLPAYQAKGMPKQHRVGHVLRWRCIRLANPGNLRTCLRSNPHGCTSGGAIAQDHHLKTLATKGFDGRGLLFGWRLRGLDPECLGQLICGDGIILLWVGPVPTDKLVYQNKSPARSHTKEGFYGAIVQSRQSLRIIRPI